MRTTITLDSDTAALLKQHMRERGLTFKQAVNALIRDALSKRGQRPFRTATAKMGQPVVNLDKALVLAAEIEDEELVRKMRLAK